MTQLREEVRATVQSPVLQLNNMVQGWLHHLARHAVACFLTRGDLYCSWEVGAKIFDILLIDSDWSINNGTEYNCQWMIRHTYPSVFHSRELDVAQCKCVL